MNYDQFAYLHLATIVPAFLLGTWLLFRRKGTPLHRTLGKIYMLLMLMTAIMTLFMSAQVGPTWLGHFGFIHLLSFLALFSVVTAYFAARQGNIRLHRNAMIGLYIGGMLIAGSFAMMPGRMLHDWLF